MADIDTAHAAIEAGLFGTEHRRAHEEKEGVDAMLL
jgi:hypothetical protein